MKLKLLFTVFVLTLSCYNLSSQNISDFVSINPNSQTEQFIIPSTHSFQKIIETGDDLTVGGTLGAKPDFTGYVPILGSSTLGYLSLNSEIVPGSVTVLDINYNASTKLWETTASEALDFSSVGGTYANCSGTVTAWGTVISCEERVVTTDINNDNYRDGGWNVEINPETKTVINKLWAMGNFQHENVAIHSNQRTAYQGADSTPGYLYKFVADNAQDLSSGNLYVYRGSKAGSGDWILLQNSTIAERNSTLDQSNAVNATVFDGVEDVEIGPDGMIYFAVKNEDKVYRFQDSDPLTGTTATMETFVGDMNYDITYSSGVSSIAWGRGNDNLAFDDLGNLWVFQDRDSGSNYIWVVGSTHTQANPEVRIFGNVPFGAEPTGITFTPDFKYLFMSIQHPDDSNEADQIDAEGNTANFDRGTALVIALNENLGTTLSNNDIVQNDVFNIFPNPIVSGETITIKGKNINNVKLFSLSGKLINEYKIETTDAFELKTPNLEAGTYFLILNNNNSIKILIGN